MSQSAFQNDVNDPFNEVLADYLGRVDDGQSVDREAFIAEHAEFADALRDYFQTAQWLQSLEPNSASDTIDWNRSEDIQHLPMGTIRYFGDYELLEEIARGGMGVVYKARQIKLDRIVAVKMILAGQFATTESIQRFRSEATAAANLRHPHIVPIYEIGEQDGHHFYSMGLVEEKSLAELISHELPDAQATAAIMIKIASAVQYAHEHGVIHRDLKPANILIDHTGQPLITDFGLAKQVEGDSELTQTGQVLGTPSYMPPEQATGRLELIGPPADVYALGAIMYALLTGRPPFLASTTIQILQQVLSNEPVPPHRITPNVSRDLETLCLKCLDKDMTGRFASAEELVEELQRFQQGRPIHSRPINRWTRAWRWCRRNPLPAILSSTICLLVMLFFVNEGFLLHEMRERRKDRQVTVLALSTMVATKSIDETETRLNSVFDPIAHELLTLADHTSDTLLEDDQLDVSSQLLMPIILRDTKISAAMIADTRGREHYLHRDNAPLPNTWHGRLMRRDQWEGKARWYHWQGDSPQTVEPEIVTDKYDPRTRPWFLLAVEQPPEQADRAPQTPVNPHTSQAVHWTDPYRFHTTQQLGISVSYLLPDQQPGRPSTVLAFDVSLRDITSWTITQHPTPNGKVLVLNHKGELLGLPEDPHWRSEHEWASLFLTPLAHLDAPYARGAAEVFSFGLDGLPQVRSFREKDAVWWGAAKPFALGTDLNLWILVLLPESDFDDSLPDK